MSDKETVLQQNRCDLEAFREEYTRKMADLRHELSSRAASYFREAASQLFADNAELKSFGWKQYTVYWNDGDETYFSARTDYPDINCLDGNEIWDGDEETKAIVPLRDKVRGFLGVFTDDDFEILFGDHVSVTVTRDGVTVEEYTDHD
jgi:hypothetical protein